MPITRPQHDRRLLLVLSLLTLAAGSGSARGATEGWLQRLQDKLDSLQTFRATFVQEYEPRAFSRRQRESGTVHFQKPGKMRWDYESPETKLALSDGQRVWIYYPQERRADVGLLDQLGDSSPAVQILMGRWRLRERFRVQSLERKGSEVTLNLVPREQEAAVKAVRITVREPDLALTVLEAEEPGGNVLRYRFEDWQEGIETSADFFLFTPPPGTRVQEIR
ncbi:MAG: outer membrane lipoprotein carrier protein LolA [Acidobacteriota bacterium]|nr:outer membrane lipoprotein carrier protein LolA [Acidobacteriota bacterium]